MVLLLLLLFLPESRVARELPFPFPDLEPSGIALFKNGVVLGRVFEGVLVDDEGFKGVL